MSRQAETGGSMGGRYTLTDRIAAGGMGEVWKAKDDILGRTVALKVLKSGLTDETGFTERFRNEARLSATLAHGNIAQVYDYGEDDGTAYLVMEYVPGRPLSKLIEERAPMSPVDTVEIIAQAANALQAAHKNGLIHRDVKPANILIDPDGTAKLTDFGIARAADAVAMTKTGEVMGTAQYLAPEAAVGRPATGLSDVYSLGVVAYEMLAGRRPFEAETAVALALAHVNQPPPPLPPFVPPTIRAVVGAALAKEPGRRPGSAAEFARAMRQALRDADRMGMLGPAPQRGPMGAQGPRALSAEQREQQHHGPSSGPQGRSAQGPGPRGPQSGPQSGPHPTGPVPAGPSGPQRGQLPGRSSGPQSGVQQRPPSGPQRTHSTPAQRGPQSGTQSGPHPTGPVPAGPSGPQRNTQGGQHGPQQGPARAPQQGPVQGPAQRPDAGSQQPTSRREVSAARRSDAKKKSSAKETPLTGSAQASRSALGRSKLIAIIAGVAAIIAIVVLVLTLGGGGDSPKEPVNPQKPQDVNTGPFNAPFTPVSMGQSTSNRSVE